MALNANAIISLADIKSFLKITDTTLDTILESWINEASSEIEWRIDNKVVSQSVTEILDGSGDVRIYPRYTPIVQISTASSPTSTDILNAIQKRVDPASAWTNILTDSTHVFTNQDWNYIELYTEVFPYGVQNIKLQYKAGYATVPADLWKVCLEMVAQTYFDSNQGKSRFGLNSESANEANGYTRTKSFKDMDKKWETVLYRYSSKSNYPVAGMIR